MKNVVLLISSCIIILILSLSYTNSIKLESMFHEPMQLNVTYYTPLRDLDEERKYSEEYINYMRGVRRLENKFKEDIDMLKMLLNTQITEIEKLNEIVYLNFATANELKK